MYFEMLVSLNDTIEEAIGGCSKLPGCPGRGSELSWGTCWNALSRLLGVHWISFCQFRIFYKKCSSHMDSPPADGIVALCKVSQAPVRQLLSVVDLGIAICWGIHNVYYTCSAHVCLHNMVFFQQCYGFRDLSSGNLGIPVTGIPFLKHPKYPCWLNSPGKAEEVRWPARRHRLLVPPP